MSEAPKMSAADIIRAGGSELTTAADLYAAWRAYCVEIGEHPWSQRRFGTAMRRRGHQSRRTTGGLWVYDGLRLLQ